MGDRGNVPAIAASEFYEMSNDARGLDNLPEEVLRDILSFCDIPSLASLAQTSRQRSNEDGHMNVSTLACCNSTWYTLIQRRFGIGCQWRRKRARKRRQPNVVLVTRSSSSSLSADGVSSKSKKRPTTYGGQTWKDAYRSLASAMRIPETSITSGSHTSGGAIFASPYRRGMKGRSVATCFGMWSMIGHTENCKTKVARGNNRSPLPYRSDRRYIELKVCVQNTKSGFGNIVVPNIASLRIVSVDEEDYFNSWGWDKWTPEYDSTFKVISDGPWAPKTLIRQRFRQTDNESISDGECEDLPTGNLEDIVLRPFELAIVSIHVACPEHMHFETDVLSVMSLLSLPIAGLGWPCNSNGELPSPVLRDVAVARFMSEEVLWEDYYCKLPGGCLSLTDRTRLIPM